VNALLIATWVLASGGYFWPGWVLALQALASCCARSEPPAGRDHHRGADPAWDGQEAGKRRVRV